MQFIRKILSRIPGSALIIIAAMLWSLDGLLRADLRTIPAGSLVMLEHLVGLIFLLPLLKGAYKSFQAASTKAKTSLVVTSIISGALGTIFYSAAIGIVFAEQIPFATIVLMQQTQPIIAIGLAALILKEKLTGRFLVQAAFAILGIYLINFPTGLPQLAGDGRWTLLVALLALAAALSWGSGTVFSKAALQEIKPKFATAGRFLIAFITAALIVIAIPAQRFPLAAVSIEQIVQLLVIAGSAGLVALLIYYRGLKTVPARVSTILELTWPAFAVVIDLARGIEYLPVQLIGMLLTAAMIYRIAREQNHKQK